MKPIEGLRKHQSEIVLAGRDMALGAFNAILAHVVPGGGKSWLPLLLANELPPEVRIAWFVPRDNLRYQAANDAKKEPFNIDLNACTPITNPCRSGRGFVTTHQSLTWAPELWRDEMLRHPYLCVIDELHHASVDPRRDDADSQLSKAIDILPWKFFLGMTGTLERSNRTRIHMLSYKECSDGAIVDELSQEKFGRIIRYNRADALAEDAIVRVEFHHGDGVVKWRDAGDDDPKEKRLSEATGDDASPALFTALRTEYANQLLQMCFEHWQACGKKMLVVCATQQEAKEAYRKLRFTHEAVSLAISDSEDSVGTIKMFRVSKGRCILVTCMMAYEGMDVKEITHVCSLTHIRSTPWIYQMLGRSWRVAPRKKLAYCFCPDDVRMTEVIRKIQAEEKASVPNITDELGKGGGGGGLTTTIPDEGEVGEVRVSWLDRPEDETEEQMQLLELLTKAGVDPDAESFRYVMQRLGPRTEEEPQAETIGEKAERLKRKLSSLCRSINASHIVGNGRDGKPVFENGWKWGRAEAYICDRYGSVDDMDVGTLEEAINAAARLNA